MNDNDYEWGVAFDLVDRYTDRVVGESRSILGIGESGRKAATDQMLIWANDPTEYRRNVRLIRHPAEWEDVAVPCAKGTPYCAGANGWSGPEHPLCDGCNHDGTRSPEEKDMTPTIEQRLAARQELERLRNEEFRARRAHIDARRAEEEFVVANARLLHPDYFIEQDNGTLVYDTPPGWPIDWAARVATNVATDEGVGVLLKFNGRECPVAPGWTPETVLAWWNER